MAINVEDTVLNVLMLAPTPFFAERGCHVRVLNSLYRLQRYGNNVDLITYPIGRDIAGININRVAKLPGYRKLAPGFSVYKPILDILLFIEAIKKMKKKEYGLLYCHLHEGALVGIFLRLLFKKKLIFDCQGSLTGELFDDDKMLQRITKKCLLPVEGWIVKSCDEILVSNSGIENIIKEKFNYSNNITLIPDIPDETIYNKKVIPVEIPELTGRYNIVYLGGLKRNKGIDYLLEAIPYTDKSIRFLIFGYPLDYVTSRIKGLGIEDRVYLKGPVRYEDSARYIAAGNIAISPKVTAETSEANAKLYSYLAVGLNVICFDTEENRSIAGDAAYYAAAGSSKDLAEKINIAYWDYKRNAAT